MHIPEFLASEDAQKRYWARSMVGWKTFSVAKPNAIHHGLAALERAMDILPGHTECGYISAGSAHVIDLHGRLHDVGV